MRGFVIGVVVALLALAGGVFAIPRFGLYPFGADNPPGSLERALASRALNAYAEKHKPAGENPTALTPENLTKGARDTRSTVRSATAGRRQD